MKFELPWTGIQALWLDTCIIDLYHRMLLISKSDSVKILMIILFDHHSI